MSKKLIMLVLASMAVGALASCGGKKEDKPSGGESKDTESQEGTSQSDEQPTLPEEYDLLKFWAGNGEESVYQVSERENQTLISYEDVTGEGAGGWEYVARPFAYDAALISQFSAYKKVSFTGKLEKTAGSDEVMIKFEGAGGTKEQRFTFASEVATYEMSLNFVNDWTQMTALLFFVNRSSNESGSGLITLDKMVLSKEEVNPDYNICPIPPQEANVYDGGDEFHVMGDWRANDTKNIVVEAKEGAYQITWGGKGEWENALAKAKDGEASIATAGFGKLNFVITGMAGRKVLCKVELHNAEGANVGQAETGIQDLTGEEQTFTVNITTELFANEYNEVWVLVFPDAGGSGNAEEQGQLTLKDVYFEKAEVVDPINHAYFPAAYLDKTIYMPGHISQSNANHVSNFEFALPGGMFWWDNNIQFKVDLSSDISWADTNYKRVVGRFTSTVAMQIVIKPYDNGAWETRVDLEANVAKDVDFVLSSDIDAETFAKSIVVFLDTGRGEQPAALSGELKVEGFRVVRENVNVGYEGATRITKANPHDKYTLGNDDDGNLTVAYAEKGWNFLEVNISAYNVAKYNHYKVTINASAATHIGLKPNDTNEKTVALNAGDNVVEFDFEVPMTDMFGKLVMFIGYDDADASSATLVFKNFEFSVK